MQVEIIFNSGIIKILDLRVKDKNAELVIIKELRRLHELGTTKVIDTETSVVMLNFKEVAYIEIPK